MQQVFGCFGCLMDIKEHFGCQQSKYLVCMVSLHSQRHCKTHLLFLSGAAELKLDVIDPIIL